VPTIDFERLTDTRAASQQARTPLDVFRLTNRTRPGIRNDEQRHLALRMLDFDRPLEETKKVGFNDSLDW
jgi:hypothetical protein